jgi:hypothetical protein
MATNEIHCMKVFKFPTYSGNIKDQIVKSQVQLSVLMIIKSQVQLSVLMILPLKTDF